jgi:hypothetical protein
LTLRTLLAYLDDTLEPGEIKHIGQKVSESETARELIARIKSVTRRRRLTTPPLTGSSEKFDPNTIAEYLDNTLAADKVEELEKLCLESDLHLAEIATCHQILTLVLGEPALVPPSARRRMVALVEKGKPSGIRKTPAAAHSPSRRSQEDSGEDDALLLGLPALSRGQGAWLRWLLPIGACLILVALAATIFVLLPKGDRYAQRRERRVTDSNAVAQNSKNGGQPEATDKAKGKAGQSSEANAAAPEKDGKQPDKDGSSKEKTNGTGAAQIDVKTPPAASNQPPTWSAAPPSARREPLGRFVRNNAYQDLLMQRPPDGDWTRLVSNSPFSSADTLVSLPGYRGELVLNNGIHMTLWGNIGQQLEGPILESAVTLHAAEPDKQGGRSDLDFTLSRGRVWLVNQKKGDQPAYVRLRFHKEIWDLTLQPNTEVGMELVGREIGLKPIQAEEGPGSSLWLVVRKGALSVRDDLHDFPPMTAPANFMWTNTQGAWPGPRPMEPWPAYWEQPVQMRRGAPAAAEMERAINALQNRLTDNRPIGSMLAETLDAAEGPAGRWLTTLCFGALDYKEDLADCLANERYPDVRDAAIEALRHWLGRNGGQRAVFNKLLEEKNYTKAEIEAILHLLRIPGAEDLTERETFSFPIDELTNDKLAIRHLAYWHLQRLAAREINKDKQLAFDPAGPPELRELVQRKWKKLLDDGKLIPDPTRGAPGAPGKQ